LKYILQLRLKAHIVRMVDLNFQKIKNSK